MDYTNETAYQAILDGAICKPGDSVYDWIHNHKDSKHWLDFRTYSKFQDFTQYVYDLRVWQKCKSVIINDVEKDEYDVMDLDGNPMNNNQEYFYEYLFIECYNWKRTESKLEILVSLLNQT